MHYYGVQTKINKIKLIYSIMEHIPFNKPCLTGKEAHYMYKAVYTGKLSGNGYFTKNVSSSLRINMVSRNVC